MRRLRLALVWGVVLGACQVQVAAPATETAPPRPTRTPPPLATPAYTATPEPAVQRLLGLHLPADQGTLFSGSGACAVCHTGLKDETGADVSVDSHWRSTLMANAARDPYWQASVRKEVLSNPQLQSTIEDDCATCHMPMARFTASQSGEQVSILDEGLLHSEQPLHTLAMDGVSCTVCHQIQEAGLGLPASYSGGFTIDTELAPGERVAYGPYKVDEDLAAIMVGASGYVPAQGLHMIRSELCATCHTVYVPYVDETGQEVGEFAQQTPYFEWFYSSYRTTQRCVLCHMPEVAGGVKVSSMSNILRSPFAQHIFVGGNAYLLKIFENFGDEITVTSSVAQFQATREQTIDQLQNRAATIQLKEVRLSGSRLTADVVVESQTGHKFPTGFPARRAWIHFMVQDASGVIVFESGGFSPDGSINGNDFDADPTRFEDHYLSIVQPDQVQIYEAVPADPRGHPTTVLLRASGYVKDNRLLPAGFDKRAPILEIQVRGRAAEDEDFDGGGDAIQYSVDLGDAQGAFMVTAELLYQSTGYGWADSLRQVDALEAMRFLTYYERVPNQPVVVSSASEEVGK